MPTHQVEAQRLEREQRRLVAYGECKTPLEGQRIRHGAAMVRLETPHEAARKAIAPGALGMQETELVAAAEKDAQAVSLAWMSWKTIRQDSKAKVSARPQQGWGGGEFGQCLEEHRVGALRAVAGCRAR